MAWIEITKAHVMQRATVAEIAANDAAGKPPPQNLLGDGNTAATVAALRYDPLAEVIKSTTVEVRGAIAEGGKTRLDTNRRTIPPSLLNVALALIVYRFASRVLAQDVVVQDARYQEYSRALDALDDIRTGKRTVEDPDTDAFTDNAGSEVATAQHDRFTRRRWRLF